jgi:DNA-binding NarL/FixJ family response regulator
MSPIRVLLADDHVMMTEALAARLSAAGDLWVAGRCAASDPNLPQIAAGVRPDVITIEVEPLAGGAGEMVARLAAPGAAVVVLSSVRDPRVAVAAARAGASAWVAKEQRAGDLERVLRTVAAGWSWWPPFLLGPVLAGLRGDVARVRAQQGPLSLLSRRERQVLAALAEGKHGGVIAGELAISPDTVRTHIRNIFGKLDVHTRLEAVKLAREMGLSGAGTAA